MSPTFRSLRNPNYRLYAAGGVVSNTGTWMQRVAQDWLVLQLTANSGAALGITTGLQFLPFLLLAPFAGLVADRMPKQRLLQITNVGMAVPPLVLGLLAVTGTAADLARLRAGLRARPRLRVRRARAPVLRLRDRRPRRPHQRGRPQLRQLQRRAPRRPRPRGPADRGLRWGSGRHRLGDPDQRRLVRRPGPGPARHGRQPPRQPGPAHPRTGGDPRGRAPTSAPDRTCC